MISGTRQHRLTGLAGLGQLAAGFQHFAAVILFDLIGRFVFTGISGYFGARDFQRDFSRIFLHDLTRTGAVAPVPFNFRAFAI